MLLAAIVMSCYIAESQQPKDSLRKDAFSKMLLTPVLACQGRDDEIADGAGRARLAAAHPVLARHAHARGGAQDATVRVNVPAHAHRGNH